ncbi:MAG: hypothetical protein RQ732_02740 [Methylophaga sp.]|nr:hypothetical protein [Methylophaga sp.]
MNETVAAIPAFNLAIAFIPVVLVFVMLVRWLLDSKKSANYRQLNANSM